MKAATVLKLTGRNLRGLGLGAREGLVLAQLDGRVTLGDVCTITGLPLADTVALAGKLLDLGVAVVATEAPAPAPVTARRTMTRGSGRVDPRAERVDPRAETEQTARPVRRPSRKSLRTQRAAAAPVQSPGRDENCELDEATASAITRLATRVGADTHYALLGLDRTADPKAIKRAYFAYVGRFHPDRFLGKKLGPLRSALERLFVGMTAAHDTLADAARREAYDATLPAAAPRPVEAPPKATSAPPTSGVQPRPAVPAPPSEDPRRLGELIARTKSAQAHERAEMLVAAAEAALKTGDVCAAANSFRLALEHRDDPHLRMQLEEVDKLAKAVRFDRSVARARDAEKNLRWEEAATYYEKAFEVRRDAAVAERAAHAIHASGGDAARAVELATQAVKMREGSADYRLTLAEVLLATNAVDRAREEAEAALSLSPGLARARAIVQVATRRQRP